MFNALGENTLHIFGACNIIAIPIVWAFYPESNQRTLEEMDLLFAAKTPWVWDAEKTFERLKAEQPDLIHAAKKGERVVDPEAGVLSSHKNIEMPVHEEHLDKETS
jgi:hypothetical protein